MLSFQEKQKTLFQRQKQLRDNPTSAESAFKEKLDFLRIKYIFQKGFIQGNNYVIVDFYLPKPYKTCIEISSNYHFHESQELRDHQRDVYLQNRNFKVIHFINDEAVNMTAAEILAVINA